MPRDVTFVFVSYNSNFHCKQCFEFCKETEGHYYTAIYALEDAFNLIVCDCSHKICGKHVSSDNICYHTTMKRTVTVQKHQLILFHGSLIHAGAPFHTTRNSHRIHMYIHPPNYLKIESKAYKTNIFECDETCNVCTKKCERNGK